MHFISALKTSPSKQLWSSCEYFTQEYKKPPLYRTRWYARLVLQVFAGRTRLLPSFLEWRVLQTPSGSGKIVKETKTILVQKKSLLHPLSRQEGCLRLPEEVDRARLRIQEETRLLMKRKDRYARQADKKDVPLKESGMEMLEVIPIVEVIAVPATITPPKMTMIMILMTMLRTI
uniref:Uncharacterized protein n=1 Tax=Candidozyma auris TaxID=498019 RepID=A0A0L0P2L6_CANAR